jgi:hypothetical protein
MRPGDFGYPEDVAVDRSAPPVLAEPDALGTLPLFGETGPLPAERIEWQELPLWD